MQHKPFADRITHPYHLHDRSALLALWNALVDIVCEYGVQQALSRGNKGTLSIPSWRRRIPWLSTLWNISSALSINPSTLVDAVESDLATGGLFHHDDKSSLVNPPDKSMMNVLVWWIFKKAGIVVKRYPHKGDVTLTRLYRYREHFDGKLSNILRKIEEVRRVQLSRGMTDDDLMRPQWRRDKRY